MYTGGIIPFYSALKHLYPIFNFLKLHIPNVTLNLLASSPELSICAKYLSYPIPWDLSFMDKQYYFRRMENGVVSTASPEKVLEYRERGQWSLKGNNLLARIVWFPWATKHSFPYDLQSQIKLSPLRETFVIIIKSVKCPLEKYWEKICFQITYFRLNQSIWL